MKTVLRFSVLLVLIFSSCLSKAQEAAASYIVSADLTYTHLGNHVYNFQLELYAECGSPTGDLSGVNIFSLSIESPSAGIQLPSAAITKQGFVDGEEVKIFCEQNITLCSPLATENSDRGLRRYVYGGNVDLSAATPQDDWIVSWQGVARTYELNSTLDNAEIELYYVDALINTKDFDGNNSVSYNSGIRGPIVRACTGEEEIFNNSAIDPDGDELRYSLATPLGDINQEIIYGAGFSPTNPVSLSSALSVDDDGAIAINATTADQIGITDVLIEEYENGILKGRTRRGIQINTFECANNAPEIGTFNTTGTDELTLCVGTVMEPGEVFIEGWDPDGDDVTFSDPISILRTPVGSTTQEEAPAYILGYFTPASASDTSRLNLRWTPLDFEVGTYEIRVPIEDNACPTPRSTEKTFIINIVANPQFELGENQIFDCSGNISLNPDQVVGLEPANYEWRAYEEFVENDGDTVWIPLGVVSTDSLFTSDRALALSLEITDAGGCFNSDSIVFRQGLYTDLEFREYCVGDETELNVIAFSRNGPDLTYEWTIEDEGVAVPVVDNNDTITYTKVGTGSFDAQVIVTDANNCKDTISATVTMCENLTETDMDITWDTPSCRRDDGIGNTVRFVDNTNYITGCEASKLSWWYVPVANPIPAPSTSYCDDTTCTISPFTDEHNEYFPDSGFYDMHLEITQVSGCIDTVVERLFIEPRQEFSLDNTVFYEDCTQDTTIQLYPDTFWVGYGPFTWEVSTDNRTTFDPIEDEVNLQHTLSDQGDYYFRVTDDSTGCQYLQVASLKDPFEIFISTDTVCLETDTLSFSSNLIQNVPERTFTNFTWNFGDGNTSSEQNPRHIFDEQGIYQVSLKVEDNTKCEDSIVQVVQFEFPLDTFAITPSILEASICVGSEVDFLTALWPGTGGNRIDTIFWDFGNGETYLYPEQVYQNPYPFTYTDTSDIVVSNYVTYWGKCRIENNGLLVTKVQREIDGEIGYIHSCIGDSIEAEFTRLVNQDIGIDSALWSVSERITNGAPLEVFAESKDLLPKFFVDPDFFDEGGIYYLHVELWDENGCYFSAFDNLDIGELPKVELHFDTACPGQPVTIDLLLPQAQVNTNRQAGTNYLVDLETNDTLIFSDNNLDNYVDPENNILYSGTATFDNANGSNPVLAYFTDVSENECRSVLDTFIYTHPVPIPDFAADTVCADYINFPTQFTNLTDTNGTTITRYHWDFNDGDTSNLVNPSHVFAEGGERMVTLSAYTDDGCVSTSDETTTAFVWPSPIADFETEDDILEALVPIDFLNMTDFSNGNYQWDMGDGTTYDDESPSHTYDEIAIYNVTLIAERDVNDTLICYDTVTKVIDLNTYLDLPTAFSPNFDGTNDELFLIHKSVRELYEYKIYNRFGELVFETDDLNTGWDGTFRGVDQEIGVYVAHVRALGAYDTMYHLKKNVTLIR